MCAAHAYLILLYSIIIIIFFENANNDAPYYAIFITLICQYIEPLICFPLGLRGQLTSGAGNISAIVSA
jgi:hypothetical protein